MSELLYEQYKDALRRGHVAALRGRLDVAAAAYREASTIAPDRALPYVGPGRRAVSSRQVGGRTDGLRRGTRSSPDGRGGHARPRRCPGGPRSACGSGRDARPPGLDPRARRAPCRRMRCRAQCARAGRVARATAAGRGPRRPAPHGGTRGCRGSRCPATRAWGPGLGAGRHAQGRAQRLRRRHRHDRQTPRPSARRARPTLPC